MKPENKFRLWFEKQFKGHMSQVFPKLQIRVQKHADAVTSGIPDLDVSIGGITVWLEVKLLTSCKKERKINVSPLQMAELESLRRAGVPAGLLVGLSLGTRKGYDVALYDATIPTVVYRDDFRSWTLACYHLVEMAQSRAEKSAAILSQVSVAGLIVDEYVPTNDESGC